MRCQWGRGLEEREVGVVGGGVGARLARLRLARDTKWTLRARD